MSLAAHVTEFHEAQCFFAKPFQCPESAKEVDSGPSRWFESRHAWQVHCASVHEHGSAATRSQTQSTTAERSAVKKASEDSFEGEDPQPPGEEVAEKLRHPVEHLQEQESSRRADKHQTGTNIRYSAGQVSGDCEGGVRSRPGDGY